MGMFPVYNVYVSSQLLFILRTDGCSLIIHQKKSQYCHSTGHYAAAFSCHLRIWLTFKFKVKGCILHFLINKMDFFFQESDDLHVEIKKTLSWM